jgi:SET domain-containing protein
MIAVGESGDKGRGVFAQKRFRTGELIERCPVILVNSAERDRIGSTVLGMYCFCWGGDAEEMAIALGYGSIYNHSYEPNADFRRAVEGGTIDFVALRDIDRGEEITINYNGVPEDQSPIWFHDGQWGWVSEMSALDCGTSLSRETELTEVDAERTCVA